LSEIRKPTELIFAGSSGGSPESTLPRERGYELLERQAVLLSFAFLHREDALVDSAVKAWVCARSKFVAPAVPAHPNNKSVATGQIMARRSERAEANPPMFSMVYAPKVSAALTPASVTTQV